MQLVRPGVIGVVCLSFACSGNVIEPNGSRATAGAASAITDTNVAAPTTDTPNAGADSRAAGAAGKSAAGSGGTVQGVNGSASTDEGGEGGQGEAGEDAIGDEAALANGESPEKMGQALQGAATCFGDATPAGTDVSVGLTPSRLSGVAPLAVYFDTDGTTATNTDRPFHDLAYCWDFGDPDSGSFAPSGLSKNHAKGPVAAHVFEQPGTYVVTVSARDAAGRVASRQVSIAVSDPEVEYAGESTVCFSGEGNFAGCPAGARQERASSLQAIQEFVASGTRLLLRRGESFTSDEELSLNVAGPGTVGAFGDGERPRILASATAFRLSDDRNPRQADWRLMDLDIEGRSDSAAGVSIGPNAKDVLVLRTRMAKLGGGVTSDISGINYLRESGSPDSDLVDRLAIQDSEIRDLVGGGGHNLLYVAGHRIMLLGNVFENSLDGEHVLRTPWLDGAVVSSNRMGDAPAGRHVFKLHAPKFNEPGVGEGKYSERIVVSDNRVQATGGHSWTFAICPQNSGSDERIRDVVVERNWFQPGESASQLELCAQDATVRDNIFNAGESMCIETSQRGVEPAPNRVAVVHNTCVTNHRGPTLIAVDPSVNASSNHIAAFNNLVIASAGDDDLTAGVTAAAGNVLGQLPIINTVARAAAESFLEFTPESGSAAVDAVRGEPVAAASPWDFSGRLRPVDGDGSGSAEPDIGALEFTP